MPPRLTAAEAVATAHALAPNFSARAAETETLRRIPDASIAELQDSGLFGIATPARWGGSELSPEVWVDVITEIAAACGSTGWVYGVLLGHMWLVSQFPYPAQDEICGQPGTLVASLIRLGGTPERVPGGYRWQVGLGRFCSGIDHAAWVVVGGSLVGSDGSPEARWFLIPRADYTVEDDWFTSGLKGTGSKSLRVADAFIPEHRSIAVRDLDAGAAPGLQVNLGPLYRLPGSTWAFVLSATPVGIARGAVALAETSLRQRLGPLSDAQLAEQSASLIRFARASADVDVAHSLLLARARRLLESAERPLTRIESAAHRRDVGYAVQQARHAVNELMELGGGSGIYDTSPMQRLWRDANAAAAHFGLSWEPGALAFTRAVLGR